MKRFLKKKKKRGKERGDVEGGGCSEGRTLYGWKQQSRLVCLLAWRTVCVCVCSLCRKLENSEAGGRQESRGKPWLLTSVSNTFSSSLTFFFGWVFKTTWVLTVYSQVIDWAGVYRWRLSFRGCSPDFNWVWFKSLQTCRFYWTCGWSAQFIWFVPCL